MIFNKITKTSYYIVNRDQRSDTCFLSGFSTRASCRYRNSGLRLVWDWFSWCHWLRSFRHLDAIFLFFISRIPSNISNSTNYLQEILHFNDLNNYCQIAILAFSNKPKSLLLLWTLNTNLLFIKSEQAVIVQICNHCKILTDVLAQPGKTIDCLPLICVDQGKAPVLHPQVVDT